MKFWLENNFLNNRLLIQDKVRSKDPSLLWIIKKAVIEVDNCILSF